jgi:hypothetical protein
MPITNFSVSDFMRECDEAMYLSGLNSSLAPVNVANLIKTMAASMKEYDRRRNAVACIERAYIGLLCRRNYKETWATGCVRYSKSAYGYVKDAFSFQGPIIQMLKGAKNHCIIDTTNVYNPKLGRRLSFKLLCLSNKEMGANKTRVQVIRATWSQERQWPVHRVSTGCFQFQIHSMPDRRIIAIQKGRLTKEMLERLQQLL